jgi:hypothetical protein
MGGTFREDTGSSLFLDVMRHRLVTGYRRSEERVGPICKGQSILQLTRPWFQMSEGFKYVAAEAWNLA